MSGTEGSPSTATAENGQQATGGATPPTGAIPVQPAGPAPDGAGVTPPTGEGQGDRLESALKAEREARKQAERDLAELRKQQTQGLTEAQQLSQRIAELEAANAKAARETLTLKIATEIGLDPLWAARLQGTDEDSLRADAEAIKQAIPAPQPTPPGVGGPQGPPAGAKSPEEWVQALRARRR